MKNTKELFKDYYPEYLEDMKALLRCPSVLDEYNPSNTEAPFGKGIKEALDKMIEIARRDGFNATNVDNYCGFIDWGEGEELVLILCHLDVVPTTGNWTNPPFDPIIKGDYIYARGTSDDKGPLMSTYYAIKMLRDEGFVPSKKIRFFFGCDEETGSRGLEHYIEKYGECDYGFSPDAYFPCIYAEKGISNIEFKGHSDDKRLVSFKAGTATNVVPDKAIAILKDIDLLDEFAEYARINHLEFEKKGNEYTLYGKAAHGSTPEKGINAALHLIHFLNQHLNDSFLKFADEYLFDDPYGAKLGIDIQDQEMGHSSSNAAVFDIEDGNVSVKDNFRYTKSCDLHKEMAKLGNFLKPFGLTVEILHYSDYHYVPKDSKLVKSLLSAYLKWYEPKSPIEAEPISIGGGTYARDFKNAIAFGCMFPGEPDCMHMPDERANLDNLVLSIFILKDAIKNLCD